MYICVHTLYTRDFPSAPKVYCKKEDSTSRLTMVLQGGDLPCSSRKLVNSGFSWRDLISILIAKFVLTSVIVTPRKCGHSSLHEEDTIPHTVNMEFSGGFLSHCNIYEIMSVLLICKYAGLELSMSDLLT